MNRIPRTAGLNLDEVVVTSTKLHPLMHHYARSMIGKHIFKGTTVFMMAGAHSFLCSCLLCPHFNKVKSENSSDAFYVFGHKNSGLFRIKLASPSLWLEAEERVADTNVQTTVERIAGLAHNSSDFAV